MNRPEPRYVRAKIRGIYFYNVYAQPSIEMEDFENVLDWLVFDVREHSPVAIAGDFNAWEIDSGSVVTDARGQTLLEAFSLLKLVLLNSGNTFTLRKGPAGSVVDLTFVSCCLAKGDNVLRVSEHYTSSDHGE